MAPNPPGRHGGLEAQSALRVRYTHAWYLAVPRTCVAVALLSRWGLGRGAPGVVCPCKVCVCVAPGSCVPRSPPLCLWRPCTRPLSHAHVTSTPTQHLYLVRGVTWAAYPLAALGRGAGVGGAPRGWRFSELCVCGLLLCVPHPPPPSPRLAPPPLIPVTTGGMLRCDCCSCASAPATSRRWHAAWDPWR
jgi:hypothetical protein